MRRFNIATFVEFAVLLTIVTVYYLFLLSNGTFQLFAPESLGKAFNNMLVHLIHGEFTVDREAIGYEAFTRDGKTYTYFGVFPAALRLFAIPFTDIAHAELARLSCLTALVIFVALQLRMLLIVHYSLPAANRQLEFLVAIVAATVLSGPQLYILGSAMIYHEPILWSAAMAAAFNLVIVRTVFGFSRLRGRDLVALAALSGLAINTRPSVGVSLYLSTILLIAWTAWRLFAVDCGPHQFSSKATRLSSSVLPPLAILGLAAVMAGFINFQRWGNAFIFADFHYYDLRTNPFLPHFPEIIQKYGEFDVGRIWAGALYYATGIPYVLIRKAVPPFAEFLRARIVDIEQPPLTPVLTNPITIILAGIGLYRVVWWKPALRTQCIAIVRLALLGHAFAVILVLGYWFFTLRYRFDFIPFMTLAALIGYRSISIAVSEVRDSWRRRAHVAAIGLCLLGILSSHYVLLMHKLWCSKIPMDVRHSLVPFAPFIRPEC